LGSAVARVLVSFALTILYEGDRLVAEYNGTALLRRYAHGPEPPRIIRRLRDESHAAKATGKALLFRTPESGAWEFIEIALLAEPTIPAVARAKSICEDDWLARAEPKQGLELLLLCAE
jgi:hypothetical protein